MAKRLEKESMDMYVCKDSQDYNDAEKVRLEVLRENNNAFRPNGNVVTTAAHRRAQSDNNVILMRRNAVKPLPGQVRDASEHPAFIKTSRDRTPDPFR